MASGRRSGDRGPQRPDEPILHVDLDAFYASVETLKDPSLAGKPVAVGGTGSRGVVMSASYEARAFGITSAMPSVRARRLAPHAVFVPPDFESYQAYSNRFREILLSFTPLVEPIALDEAFLDVGGAGMLFGEPEGIGHRIREEVHGRLGLRCSVGVAPNKFLAKLASTRAKPNGLIHVPRNGILQFLHPLPVGALWGAGEKTVETLGRLGIRTVAELAAVPTGVLARTLGEARATMLSELARGVDDRHVVPYEAPKSVSHEETFDRDLDDDDEILREILALSRRVGARLRKEGYAARIVVLKIRLANFTTLTRSRTLPRPTDVAAEITAVASGLYRALPGARRRIRLLGVQASGLATAGAEQLGMLAGTRWGDLERTVDRIERRFGRDAAMPATLLGRSPVQRGPEGEQPTRKSRSGPGSAHERTEALE
ncbi:MAG: DNA polymerase IV [Actinomycetota bacterium]|nr:DNA polymerase IV [Actinomycetota bacterium]